MNRHPDPRLAASGVRFGQHGVSGTLFPASVPVRVEEVHGDLLERDVDFLVNPWNRNYLPRWLTPWSSGVSGALKKHTGPGPWKTLRSHGTLEVGDGVATSSGRMREDLGILHVAGLDTWWRANSWTVATSVRNAVLAAADLDGRSVALPLIGSGTGGLSQRESLAVTREVLASFGASIYDRHREPLLVEIVHQAIDQSSGAQ